MNSWRDATPMGVQDEIDELFAAAVEAAIHFRASRGEFHPMGFYTDVEGEGAGYAADRGLGEFPPATELIASLREVGRSDRDWLRVVAIISDVTMLDGHDALCVEVNQRDGPTLEVVAPYELRRVRRSRVRFDQMAVSYAPSWVWAPNTHDTERRP